MPRMTDVLDPGVYCDCGEPFPDRRAGPALWQAFIRRHDHPQPGEPDPTPCPPWCSSRAELGDLDRRHGYERDNRYNGAWTRFHVSSNGPICIEQVEIRRGDQVDYEPPHVYVDLEGQELSAAEARAIADELHTAADQLDRL